MLIQFFKKDNPSSFILLPLFALVLWVAGFVSEQSVIIKHSMPLYEMLAKPLSVIPFIATLTSLILVVCEAFLLNYIVNENEILIRRSFLPALFYIIFMSNDKSMLMLHPLLFSNFFILLAINKLLSSYLKDAVFSHAFDAGLLFSIATLFYFPSIFLIPVLCIGFIIFRTFNWREWLISFIGITVPYAFVAVYYFWYEKLDYLWHDKMFYPVFRNQLPSSYTESFYFMLVVSGIVLLFSFGNLFIHSIGTSQKKTKGIRLLIGVLFFALLSLFRAPEISLKYFSFLAIPLSVFCANYFLKIKREWWGEFLFLLLITAIFINLFVNHF